MALIAQDPPKPSITATQATRVDNFTPLTSIVSAKDPAQFETDKFHIIEGESLQVYLDRLEYLTGQAPAVASEDNAMEAEGTAATDGNQAPAAPAATGMDTD